MLARKIILALTMVSTRLLLALFCAISVAYISAASGATWKNTDSIPSLYNSFATYCDPGYLQNWTCGYCTHNKGSKFVGFMIDKKTSVFGYVSILGNEINVAFRGSECIMNWLDNLNAFFEAYTPVPGAFVHTGFHRAYSVVRDQTRANVAAALKMCPTCSIRTTGHSLGGALATHAAADLSFVYKPGTSGAPAIKLTTFGSPRVGESVFSNWLTKQLASSWRMTHYCDPVPHLPPRFKGLDWHHVATEVYEGKTTNTFTQCDTSGEDPKCANSILLPFNVDDHLTYMGVNSNAGKRDRCQTKGPNCDIVTQHWATMDWEARFPGIRNH